MQESAKLLFNIINNLMRDKVMSVICLLLLLKSISKSLMMILIPQLVDQQKITILLAQRLTQSKKLQQITLPAILVKKALFQTLWQTQSMSKLKPKGMTMSSVHMLTTLDMTYTMEVGLLLMSLPGTNGLVWAIHVPSPCFSNRQDGSSETFIWLKSSLERILNSTLLSGKTCGCPFALMLVGGIMNACALTETWQQSAVNRNKTIRMVMGV